MIARLVARTIERISIVIERSLRGKTERGIINHRKLRSGEFTNGKWRTKVVPLNGGTNDRMVKRRWWEEERERKGERERGEKREKLEKKTAEMEGRKAPGVYTQKDSRRSP